MTETLIAVCTNTAVILVAAGAVTGLLVTLGMMLDYAIGWFGKLMARDVRARRKFGLDDKEFPSERDVQNANRVED